MNIHRLWLPSRQIQTLLAVALFSWSAAASAVQAVSTPPPNAHANAYGSDWTCNHGFVRRIDACVAVFAPENAYPNSSGGTWECDRGFVKQQDDCSAGNDWRCVDEYRRSGDRCVASQTQD